MFVFSSYRLCASFCKTTRSGSGVALLVHETIKNVEDAKSQFEESFNAAKVAGIEIAGVKLQVKINSSESKDYFVFGIYRRKQCSQHEVFCRIICDLLLKVKNKYQTTAIVTGDFNYNNNEADGSKKIQEVRAFFKSAGYKFTHTKVSHQLGSCLDNFLVPLHLKYTQRTLDKGLIIPNNQLKKVSPKGSDHKPIELVVTFSSKKGPECSQVADQGRRPETTAGVTEVDPKPSTSQFALQNMHLSNNSSRTTQPSPEVIVISDSEDDTCSDEEENLAASSINTRNQSGLSGRDSFTNQASSRQLNLQPNNQGVCDRSKNSRSEPSEGQACINQHPQITPTSAQSGQIDQQSFGTQNSNAQPNGEFRGMKFRPIKLEPTDLSFKLVDKMKANDAVGDRSSLNDMGDFPSPSTSQLSIKVININTNLPRCKEQIAGGLGSLQHIIETTVNDRDILIVGGNHESLNVDQRNEYLYSTHNKSSNEIRTVQPEGYVCNSPPINASQSLSGQTVAQSQELQDIMRQIIADFFSGNSRKVEENQPVSNRSFHPQHTAVRDSRTEEENQPMSITSFLQPHNADRDSITVEENQPVSNRSFHPQHTAVRDSITVEENQPVSNRSFHPQHSAVRHSLPEDSHLQSSSTGQPFNVKMSTAGLVARTDRVLHRVYPYAEGSSNPSRSAKQRKIEQLEERRKNIYRELQLHAELNEISKEQSQLLEDLECSES